MIQVRRQTHTLQLHTYAHCMCLLFEATWRQNRPIYRMLLRFFFENERINEWKERKYVCVVPSKSLKVEERERARERESQNIFLFKHYPLESWSWKNKFIAERNVSSCNRMDSYIKDRTYMCVCVNALRMCWRWHSKNKKKMWQSAKRKRHNKQRIECVWMEWACMRYIRRVVLMVMKVEKKMNEWNRKITTQNMRDFVH